MDHNLRAVEAHEVAKDKHSQKWNDAYHFAYKSIPEELNGEMLREAVDSLKMGDTLDNVIISAYDRGDREEAITALFMLLDSWRKREAERIAYRETGE